jgi:hypothetical protein
MDEGNRRQKRPMGANVSVVHMRAQQPLMQQVLVMQTRRTLAEGTNTAAAAVCCEP